MARIEKVFPTLIGQARDATVAVQKAPYPGESLSRDLKGFGNDMKGIFDGLIKLGQEGQQLALAQAKTDFNTEITERLDSEVFNAVGLSPEEAGQKAQDILKSAGSRQLEKLSAYGGIPGRMFQMYAENQSVTHLSGIIRHAESQARSRTLQAEQSNMKFSLENYSKSASDRDMESMLESYDLRMRLLGNTMTGEKAGVFEENLKKGFVRVGGKDYQVRNGIAEGMGPGGRGVSVEQLRDRILREAKAYEEGRQNLIDQAHSVRMDELKRSGDVDGMSAHLSQNAPGGKYSMSPRAYEAAKPFVQRALSDREASLYGNSEISRLHADYAKSDPMSEGGTLSSPEFRRMLMEAEQSQYLKMVNAKNDPFGYETKKYYAMKQRIKEILDGMDNTYKARRDEFLQYARNNGLLRDPNLFSQAVREMAPSYLQRELCGLAAQREQTANKNRRDMVNELIRRIDGGETVWHHGRAYDTSDPQQRELLLTLSVGEENAKEIRSRTGRMPYGTVCGCLADALNELGGRDMKEGSWYTSENVTAVAPDLLDIFFRETEGRYTKKDLEGTEGKKIIKDKFKQLLMMQARAGEPGIIMSARNQKLHEYYNSLIQKDGTFKTIEREIWNATTRGVDRKEINLNTTSLRGIIDLSDFCKFGMTEEDLKNFTSAVKSLRRDPTTVSLGDEAETVKLLNLKMGKDARGGEVFRNEERRKAEELLEERRLKSSKEQMDRVSRIVLGR